MKNFKYFFVCVLYLNILGLQSCKKDLPDPEPVKIYHTITILTADGVTISPALPNNSTKVENGKPFSLNFNSDPNKRYKVLSNGVVVADFRTGSFNYSISSVNTDLNLQIVTEAVTFTVTATAGIGGSVTPSGSTVVEYGKDLTLTPTENPEYTLTAIKVKGVSVAITKPYILANILADTDVKFEFTLTNILIITNGADNKSRYWKLTNWDWYDANHVYEYSSILNPSQLTDKDYFYTNGKLESIDATGTIWPDYWNILPGNIFTLSSGVRIFKIIELTDNKFVYELKGEFTLGVTEYKRSTFIRQ